MFNSIFPKPTEEDVWARIDRLLKEHRYDEALKKFDDIDISDDPDFMKAQYHRTKGNCYLHLGRLKEAVDCYDLSISIEVPMGLTLSMESKATVFYNQKQYSEALKIYKDMVKNFTFSQQERYNLQALIMSVEYEIAKQG